MIKMSFLSKIKKCSWHFYLYFCWYHKCFLLNFILLSFLITKKKQIKWSSIKKKSNNSVEIFALRDVQHVRQCWTFMNIGMIKKSFLPKLFNCFDVWTEQARSESKPYYLYFKKGDQNWNSEFWNFGIFKSS